MNRKITLRKFLAFLLDLSIGHLLFFILLSFGPVDTLMESILDILRSQKGLLKIFNVDQVYLASIIGIYLFTYILKFYCTLFFRRSPGQYIMFIKSGGGFLWGRVGGALRELLGIVTTPFIIFDLPLVQKLSLKEKITLSHIENVPNRKGHLIGLPSAVFVFIFSFFGPLFFHMSVIDGLVVNFDKAKKIKLNNQTQFENFKLFQSNRFMFETFSDLSEGRFVLLPDFELLNNKKKSLIKPYIKVYDTQKKSIYHIYLKKAYSLLKVLDKASTGNFLFEKKYPKVSNAIDNSALYKRWPSVNNKKMKKLFSKELIQEIQALVESSMEVSYGNLFGHIVNNGPFIRGHIELRNTLLEIVEEGVSPQVDIVDFGNSSFLRFRHEFENLEFTQKAFQETLMPIDTPYSQVLIITCERCNGDYQGLEKFKEKFFGGAIWMFDYQQNKYYPRTREQVTSLSITDYLNHTKMNNEQLIIFERGIFENLFGKAKLAFNKQDDDLIFEIGESLRKAMLIINSVNKAEKDYYSNGFISELNSLKNAIGEKNKEYFNKVVNDVTN